MTTQTQLRSNTEAERLADELDSLPSLLAGGSRNIEIAAELRRLVSFNQQLMDEVARLNKAVAAEREACAKVAGWLWQQFQDTKDAHERNSMEPFVPSQFGFDQPTVQQSKRMMDAIRARGNI
jgi:hypothetical protein